MRQIREIDQEIQEKLKKHRGNIREILQDNHRMDLLYALSDQRELLLEWYDFDPEAELLQVGADAGALTGLYRTSVRQVTVLDAREEALETVRMRYSTADNVTYIPAELCEYAKEAAAAGRNWDYVVMLGNGANLDREHIAAAKSLLKKNGVFIMACTNPAGVKYWAGTADEETGLSRKRLQEFCETDGDGYTRFYYPMPDYRLPSTIYTDRYLPKKGDLTRVTEVYDYPPYHVIDMGEKFDMVCEEGIFDQCANSYLVFWSRDRGKLYPTEDRIFIKYNKTRQDIFQIRTCIGERHADGKPGQADSAGRKCRRTEDTAQNQTEALSQEGRRPEAADERRPERFVEKAALGLPGSAHILSFEEKYQQLSAQQRSIRLLPPEAAKGRSAAFFCYLEGQTRAEELGYLLRNEGEATERIRESLQQIFDVNPDCRRDFQITEDFLEVFGQGLSQEELAALDGDTACKVSNIDALFENIMDTGDGSYCLDYEWVFSFPVPERYVCYRILYYFYEQYGSLMKTVTLRAFLENFGIAPEMADIYRKMETSFQTYVHGDNQKLYLENYLHGSKGVEGMLRDERDLAHARERISQMKLYINEKDVTIRKITEVKRLTDNHVTNLEIIIRDLRHEIDEMARTLAYLNTHEALIFRMRRKLGEWFNRKYPRGSAERKRLQYRKESILHPIRSHRLYATEEGKNLRKGDFEIGDIYREHGKLRFAQPEQPKVSIVIPVYNQIAYTYACLVSILKYTKDVSYEVIIADDVSTDATAHLSEFAEGLVICRNSSNQGFLRNCNQAARSAKGEYIMFLNNDTQVTEGWLSSLVTLIESEESIGMVGSKLVYPDGRLQEAGGIIWSDGSGWNYGRLDQPDKPEYNYVKDVDYISGAAILLPVKLWEQIGGFDTRFAPAYCEDSDLAFEVRKAGYRVVYQPLSKVIHFEGISNGTDVQGSGLKRYQAVNLKKLQEKWKDEFAKQCENTGNPDPFRARERSMGKKIILVVDHYVPTYDRDAGSRTTFQYIKMFLQKGYVVKFVGDNYMHEEPYSTTLQQMGVEILYGPEYQTGIWNWLRDHGDDIAVAYLNRPHIATKYIDYILDNTDIKVIYYGHDLHFLRETREYEITGDPKILEDAEYWKSLELSLMQKAAVSYYPSYIERDAIHAIDPLIPVKDITAYVFDSFLSDIREDFSEREGLLFVGGFAHPPNADAVIWFAKEIYPQIREEFVTAGCEPPKFYVVGSKVTEEIQALAQPDNGVIIKGFVSDEELAGLYAECRVVVVPLRYGAGIKGKIIEALYYGAPVITTSVGAEGIPQAEDVLLIEDDPERFAQATAALYQDTDRCRELSRRTQSYIRRYFSVDAAWQRIEEDFS